MSSWVRSPSIPYTLYTFYTLYTIHTLHALYTLHILHALHSIYAFCTFSAPTTPTLTYTLASPHPLHCMVLSGSQFAILHQRIRSLSYPVSYGTLEVTALTQGLSQYSIRES